MTSLQLLLLLLSMHRQTEAFRYPRYRNHHYARTPEKDSCYEQEVISEWINTQVTRNAKITRFNQRLWEMLKALSANNTAPIEEGHCCFYEKNTMDQLFAEISLLYGKLDMGKAKALKKTGDIGQDLDLILDSLKKVFNKDMESCCDRLTNNYNELEADINKQLEKLKHKFNEQKNHETEQKENQTAMQEKLNELKKSVEKLEEQQKDNITQKCCKEIELKLNELKTQLETAQKEAKEGSAKLEKELKELQLKQKEQENKIKDLEKELEKRAENTAKVMEKCEKNCNNKQQENETDLIAIRADKAKESDLKRLDNLEELIKHLIENNKKLMKMIESLKQCEQIENDLSKTKEKINQLEEYNKFKNKSDRIKCKTDQEELKQEMENAKDCCKNIDTLAKNKEDLQKKLKQMNSSYNKHIDQLAKDIDHVQDSLNRSSKPNELHSDYAKSNSKDINPQIDELKVTLSDNAIQLSKLQNETQDNFNDCKQIVADQAREMDKFLKKLEQVNNDLEVRKRLNKTDDEKPRLDRLERQQDQLSEDIDKALQLDNRVGELEKQLKDALGKLNLMQATVDQCAKKCKYLDNIDDLIDRIEDLEAVLNFKKSKNKGGKNGQQSAVGGVDY